MLCARAKRVAVLYRAVYSAVVRSCELLNLPPGSLKKESLSDRSTLASWLRFASSSSTLTILFCATGNPAGPAILSGRARRYVCGDRLRVEYKHVYLGSGTCEIGLLVFRFRFGGPDVPRCGDALVLGRVKVWGGTR